MNDVAIIDEADRFAFAETDGYWDPMQRRVQYYLSVGWSYAKVSDHLGLELATIALWNASPLFAAEVRLLNRTRHYSACQLAAANGTDGVEALLRIIKNPDSKSEDIIRSVRELRAWATAGVENDLALDVQKINEWRKEWEAERRNDGPRITNRS